MLHILFICTANLYRSPLAAEIFRNLLQRDGRSHEWVVKSAGTWSTPGRPVPADVLRAAKAIGVDLQTHATQQVDHALLAKQDLILVMEKGHREALSIEFPSVRHHIYLLSEMADLLEYDIPDPAKTVQPIHETVAELLKLVNRAYPNICRLAQNTKNSET